MMAIAPKMPNTMPTMDPVELCCTSSVKQSYRHETLSYIKGTHCAVCINLLYYALCLSTVALKLKVKVKN